MARRIGLGMEAREGAEIGRLQKVSRIRSESKRGIGGGQELAPSQLRHTTAGRHSAMAHARWDCLQHVPKLAAFASGGT